MDYKTFETLAKGYMQESRYYHELRDTLATVAKKHNVTTDFIGLPFDDNPSMEAIMKVINDFDTEQSFGYFFYECDGDFDKFNANISWKDGEKTFHPDCHNLEDLWKYILYENGPQGGMKDAPIKGEG